ncbi:unnamed protein product [Sphenostylis stenocarpa]|uniref:Uncharacterized protein n=1 Tax=Sphenostylis stenocarpa TaxID=92480 RepID=A0AA86T242_9FABA|nr:unnamed protein product [Sphenostylis stenocarpa]
MRLLYAFLGVGCSNIGGRKVRVQERVFETPLGAPIYRIFVQIRDRRLGSRDNGLDFALLRTAIWNLETAVSTLALGETAISPSEKAVSFLAKSRRRSQKLRRQSRFSANRDGGLVSVRIETTKDLTDASCRDGCPLILVLSAILGCTVPDFT